jgi:hypothetical protein
LIRALATVRGFAWQPMSGPADPFDHWAKVVAAHLPLDSDRLPALAAARRALASSL